MSINGVPAVLAQYTSLPPSHKCYLPPIAFPLWIRVHTLEYLQFKDLGNQKPSDHENSALFVARIIQPSVHRLLFAGAVCLIFDCAVTVDVNTSFPETSAGVDGSDYSLVTVRYFCSCYIWLCVAIRCKICFRYSSTATSTPLGDLMFGYIPCGSNCFVWKHGVGNGHAIR